MCSTIIFVSVACCFGLQCICGSHTSHHRSADPSVGSSDVSRAFELDRHTSSDRITGSSETMNAHAPTAFAQFSKLSMVQKV